MTARYITPDAALIPVNVPASAAAASPLTLDSSGDRAAYLHLITKAGNIRKATFRTGTVTSLVATLRISLQTVSGGDPDGTPDQTATQAAPASNTWYQVTLDADRAVVVGEVIAVVVDFSAYTSGSIQIQFGASFAQEPHLSNQPSYRDFYNGSAWTKTADILSLFILEYDDGTVAYQPSSVPFPTASATTWNSGSATSRYANKITFDEDTIIAGIGGLIDTDNALDLILYDTDGTTVLGTATVDPSARPGSASSTVWALFSAPVTVQGGSVYYIAVVPGASSVTMFRPPSDADQAKNLGVLPGGADWYESTYDGSWNDNTARRNPIWPIVLGMDIAAGGGGMLVHPGMSGGMRG